MFPCLAEGFNRRTRTRTRRTTRRRERERGEENDLRERGRDWILTSLSNLTTAICQPCRVIYSKGQREVTVYEGTLPAFVCLSMITWPVLCVWSVSLFASFLLSQEVCTYYSLQTVNCGSYLSGLSPSHTVTVGLLACADSGYLHPQQTFGRPSLSSLLTQHHSHSSHAFITALKTCLYKQYHRNWFRMVIPSPPPHTHTLYNTVLSPQLHSVCVVCDEHSIVNW